VGLVSITTRSKLSYFKLLSGTITAIDEKISYSGNRSIHLGRRGNLPEEKGQANSGCRAARSKQKRRAASQGTNNSRLPHMGMLHAAQDHGPQVFDPGRPGGFPVLPAPAKRSDSSQKRRPPAQAGKHPASARYFSGAYRACSSFRGHVERS